MPPVARRATNTVTVARTPWARRAQRRAADVARIRGQIGDRFCRATLAWAGRRLAAVHELVELGLVALGGAMTLFNEVDDPRVAGAAVEEGGVPVALEGKDAAESAWYRLEELSFVMRALSTGAIVEGASPKRQAPEYEAPPAPASVRTLQRVAALARAARERVDDFVDTFYAVMGVEGRESFAGVSARIDAEGVRPLALLVCAQAEYVEQRMNDLDVSLSCLGEGLIE